MRKWIAAFLALALVLSGCVSAKKEPETPEGQPIYYLTREGTAGGGDMIRESCEVLELEPDASLQETAVAVVERLLRGPEDRELESPIPSGTELLGLEIRERWAYVDFSGGLDRLSGVDLTLADYCLTLSLTALDGVNAVTVTVRGKPLVQQPKQAFFERDVLLSTMDDVLQLVEVTLYFLDSGGALAGETRMLEIYEGQTVAENLVDALLEGPESKDLTAVIPEGFAVSSVRVDSGVCYVNLPEASLDLLPAEEEQQRMILWSLADSLYSIETVQEMRLLADGQELEYFGSVPTESVAVRPQG